MECHKYCTSFHSKNNSNLRTSDCLRPSNFPPLPYALNRRCTLCFGFRHLQELSHRRGYHYIEYFLFSHPVSFFFILLFCFSSRFSFNEVKIIALRHVDIFSLKEIVDLATLTIPLLQKCLRWFPRGIIPNFISLPFY